MSAVTDLELEPKALLRVVPPHRPDEDLTTEELGSRIVGLAGRLAAASCRWLLLVADFDKRDGCAKWGLATTAAWLMHTCALSRRTAFEHVRVARALAEQPTLIHDMSTGRLSYSQVRAITRAVQPGDVQTTADLSQAAQHCSIGQLETVVRGLRVCDDPTPRDEEDYVRTGWTSGSRWRLTARLDPEDGALVESVLATVARADDLTRARALARMAELALLAINDRAHPPRAVRGDELAAVVVHVEASDIPTAPRESPLTDNGNGEVAQCSREHSPASAAAPAPAGHLADGPGLRWPVVERLLCMGRIRAAVHDGDGNIQHLGRSHRTVPRRLFLALLHRDHGECTHPGCTRRTRLQAHHVRHWLWGGRTDLRNLVLLCEGHHRAHHDGKFFIRPDGSRRGFAFIRRDGFDLSAPAPAGRLAAAEREVDEAHAATGTNAATPRWDGTRMDRRFAVACFAEGRARERTRNADTARSTLTG